MRGPCGYYAVFYVVKKVGKQCLESVARCGSALGALVDVAFGPPSLCLPACPRSSRRLCRLLQDCVCDGAAEEPGRGGAPHPHLLPVPSHVRGREWGRWEGTLAPAVGPPAAAAAGGLRPAALAAMGRLRSAAGLLLSHAAAAPPRPYALCLLPARLNILESAIKEEQWRYCRIDGSVASAAGRARACCSWGLRPASTAAWHAPTCRLSDLPDRVCLAALPQSARRACASSRPPTPSPSSCSPLKWADWG